MTGLSHVYLVLGAIAPVAIGYVLGYAHATRKARRQCDVSHTQDGK